MTTNQHDAGLSGSELVRSRVQKQFALDLERGSKTHADNFPRVLRVDVGDVDDVPLQVSVPVVINERGWTVLNFYRLDRIEHLLGGDTLAVYSVVGTITHPLQS